MRLDKYLSQSTGLSRSQVRKLIKAGEVSVNGSAVEDAAFAVADEARVSLAGESIAPPAGRYLMLHKPAGYVCANKDPDHPTVIDLLWQVPRPENLQIVGRLDIDATGLVLVTDDGQWNHKITSPRTDTPKTYHVWLAESLTEAQTKQLRQGVLLRNEKQRSKPAKIVILSPREIRITISEGRYHQIKRMFAAVGNRVEALHREQIGNIILDAALEPGEYRALSQSEIETV